MQHFAGPDIFLGKTYAKVLGSFFVAWMVNKKRLLFTGELKPDERSVMSVHD